MTPIKKRQINFKCPVSKLVKTQKENNHNTFIFLTALIMAVDMGLFSMFYSVKDNKYQRKNCGR